MDVLLTNIKSQFAFMNLDDIVIFSSTLHEHIDHVRQKLMFLYNVGVTLNRKSASSLRIVSIFSVMSFVLGTWKYQHDQLTRFADSNTWRKVPNCVDF